MSHQINFYLTPSDIDSILAKVAMLGKFAVLPSRSPTNTPVILGGMNYECHGEPWLYFYLVRLEDIDSVTLEYVRAQDYWTVDVFSSPVIEFNKCFFNGEILRRGRVYYKSAYYDDDSNLVGRPHEFLLWAKAVFKTMKKNMRRINDVEYIGEAASSWLESGDRRLDPGY
jgi:hypothetical protein